MKSANGIRSKTAALGFTGLATLLVLIPMLYNGTPLYYPDSMGYIFWGQKWQPVPERVSTYAAFIRGAALGKDLWFPVLLQGLLAVIVLKRLWKRLCSEEPSVFFLISACLLGLLSPLGWTASTLMPDIFCVLSSLFLYLLLFPDLGKRPALYDVAGFAFCTAQHLSALLINGLLFLVFVFWSIYKKSWKSTLHTSFSVLTGLILSCLVIGVIHWTMSKSFFISRSSPSFLTARLIETGVASRYLGQHKSEFPELQAIKKQFPMSAEQFLWQTESPILHLGGLKDPLGIMADFNGKVLSEPSGLILFLKAGIKSGIKQFFLLDLGDGIFKGTMEQVRYYPENLAESTLSRQFTGIDFYRLNVWCQSFFVFLLILFAAAFREQFFTPEMKMLAIFILALLLLNAFVNGALATPLNRYQVRLSWLVYFWLLAGIYLSLRKNRTINFRSYQP